MITYNRKDSEKEYRHIYSETLFASETITTLKINYTSSKKKKRKKPDNPKQNCNKSLPFTHTHTKSNSQALLSNDTGTIQP